MNGWRGAWYLAKHEWRRDRIAMLITVLFILYMLLMLYQFYEQVNEPDALSISWSIDMLQLALLPIMGFCANRTMIKVWREDSISNKIASWRSMPISIQQIVGGRLIQMLGMLTVSLLVYFIALYALSSTLRGELDAAAYTGYALFWYGYAAGIAGTLIFLEQGFSGKTYTVVSFLYVVLYVGATIIIHLMNHSITLGVMHELQEGNWWYTACSLLFGAVLILIVYRITCERLKVRSYTR